MDMSAAIRAACATQHKMIGSVLPPQVCPFCMGCPIGAIVGSGQTPTPIPASEVASVQTWLDSMRTKESYWKHRKEVSQ